MHIVWFLSCALVQTDLIGVSFWCVFSAVATFATQITNAELNPSWLRITILEAQEDGLFSASLVAALTEVVWRQFAAPMPQHDWVPLALAVKHWDHSLCCDGYLLRFSLLFQVLSFLKLEIVLFFHLFDGLFDLQQHDFKHDVFARFLRSIGCDDQLFLFFVTVVVHRIMLVFFLLLVRVVFQIFGVLFLVVLMDAPECSLPFIPGIWTFFRIIILKDGHNIFFVISWFFLLFNVWCHSTPICFILSDSSSLSLRNQVLELGLLRDQLISQELLITFLLKAMFHDDSGRWIHLLCSTLFTAGD